MARDTLGFWSDLGAAASKDWCEANYAMSPFIAEWWNTWSSLAIVAAGVWGLWRWRGGATEVRFRWAFAAIALVGVGSVAFHATLLRLAQASDELPMIYAGLLFAYLLRWRSEPADRTAARRWQAAMALYALAFTLAYLFVAGAFVFFIASYAALVAWISLRTVQLALVAGSSQRAGEMGLLAVGAYVGGFLLLWLPENVLLSCDHPLQRLQLHALFHLTSALGSTAWVLFALADRAAVLDGGGEAS